MLSAIGILGLVPVSGPGTAQHLSESCSRPPPSPQSLTVVFREPFPVQPQNSESPLPQLVSTYHHLESVINTACFNLWTGLL